VSLDRRSPMKRTGRIKARREAPRRTADRADGHGQPWEEVRVAIFARSGGRCEVCRTDLNNSGMDAHHRRRRRIGPDCSCNALALCPSCHREVHAHPAAARAVGHIVSDPQHPATVGVLVARRGRVLLTCDGAYADG
jgi:5-methylcytosine-specific restriction endonuclease McrA